MQAFDVSAQDGLHPNPFDESVQIHDDAGLVAIDVGQNHASLIGINLENRAHRAVQLGIHHDHMFAVLNGLEHHLGAEFHRASHLDDDIYALCLAEQKCVIGDRIAVLRDRILQLRNCFNNHHVLNIGFVVRAPGLIEIPVGNRHQFHAGR